MEGWKNMGENVKRTAEKLSSSKKVDEAREAELRQKNWLHLRKS